jgi:hypothetical protein
LRVFEDRVLRRIFGPEREEVARENCIMRNFIMCTLHQMEVYWTKHVAEMRK